MNKNSVLLSIGAALLCSLFVVDVGLAFQADKKKDASIVMAGDMKGTTNLSTAQASNTSDPCTVGGKGRVRAPGAKHCPSKSGEMATNGSLHTRHVSTTANPCTGGGKGRTGAPGTKLCPSGSGVQARDARIVMAADMNSLTGGPLQVAGILFAAGFIALVGLGARKLRHPHRHHA